MIIVTGAAGFIGSAYIWHLNSIGVTDIIGCDNFGHEEKWHNLKHSRFIDLIDINQLLDFIQKSNNITLIVHMGACSDTMETDMDYLYENNTMFSKSLWNLCLKRNIRFIYASSAATYGNGEKGYEDKEEKIPDYCPLNKYAYSKQLFDLFVIQQKRTPGYAGLKFFNVYGPNEAHKGKGSSVVYHGFKQIMLSNQIKLFKSYKRDIRHGEQKRDFIYIKDVVKMMDFFRVKKFRSGIYNIGTGTPLSFNELADSLFKHMDKKKDIKYIDMPEHIMDKYQYLTVGRIEKLRKQGFKDELYNLETGVKDYVLNYLSRDDPFLK